MNALKITAIVIATAALLAGVGYIQWHTCRQEGLSALYCITHG